MRIFGKVIDENYTRMLLARTDLSIWDVIALDKVQKGKPVTDEELKVLKKKRLIEGRRPNYFVSAEVAAATETKADYIKKRAFDKTHYKQLVLAYLDKFGPAKRSDMEKLLFDKLSDTLTDEQKKTYIMNLLQKMRREKSIQRIGGSRGIGAKWSLHNALSKSPDLH